MYSFLMEPIFVSVVTPTYNRRKFIPTLLKCFEDQTYPETHRELIILDDGTDKVADLCVGKNISYYELPEKC